MPDTTSKLRAHLAQHRYLPGSLEYLLSTTWADQATIDKELRLCLERLQTIPNDGSIGSLSKNEKCFLRAFKES